MSSSPKPGRAKDSAHKPGRAKDSAPGRAMDSASKAGHSEQTFLGRAADKAAKWLYGDQTSTCKKPGCEKGVKGDKEYCSKHDPSKKKEKIDWNIRGETETTVATDYEDLSARRENLRLRQDEGKEIEQLAKQQGAKLEQQRERNEQRMLELDKKPSEYADYDPERMSKDGRGTARMIKLEQRLIEDESRKLEQQTLHEEAKLKLRSEKHKEELVIKQDEQRFQYDRERKRGELDSARRHAELDIKKADKRQKHELTLQQMELDHEIQMHEKDREFKQMKEEHIRAQAELDSKFHEQDIAHKQESERHDREWRQTREELERKKLTEERELEIALARSRQEYDKKLGEEKLQTEKEIEEQFLSRMTTEYQIEKADGTKVRIREAEAGLVSRMVPGSALSPALMDKDGDESGH